MLTLSHFILHCYSLCDKGSKVRHSFHLSKIFPKSQLQKWRWNLTVKFHTNISYLIWRWMFVFGCVTAITNNSTIRCLRIIRLRSERDKHDLSETVTWCTVLLCNDRDYSLQSVHNYLVTIGLTILSIVGGFVYTRGHPSISYLF